MLLQRLGINFEVVVLDGNRNTQIKEELFVCHADRHSRNASTCRHSITILNSEDTIVDKFSIAHFVRNDQLPHRTVVHIFANAIRHELNGIIPRFHLQRVNDLNIQRTLVVLVLNVIINIVSQNFLARLIGHIQVQTAVTLTLNTSNHRNVTILRIKDVLNRFVRNTNGHLDVSTTSQIGGLLTIEVVGVQAEVLIIVITVCQHKEVVFFMVDKNLVRTRSKFIFRDSEGVRYQGRHR